MLHTLDEDNDDEDVVTDNLKYGHVRVDVLKSCSNAYRRMGKNATVVSRFNGEGGGGGSRPSTASSVRSSKNNRTSHTILSHADQVFHVVNDELAALQLHSEIRSELFFPLWNIVFFFSFCLSSFFQCRLKVVLWM